MFKKKAIKTPKRSKQIIVPENAREFYIKNLFSVYNYEKERENNLLEQASRLLVTESLVANVFFQIVLSDTKALNEDYYLIMGFVLGVLIVGALITTLISQHRFFRVGTPNFDEIKECISKRKSDMKTEDFEFDYSEAFVEKMYKSLKELNDFRFWMLTVSVLLILFTLIGALSVSVEFAKDVF